MKKLILFIAIILLSNITFAQTSLEEYNYVTKGYKVQIESGLDMKKGYVFEDVARQEAGSRKVDIKCLYKLNSNNTKSIVAYLVIYQLGSNEKEYICIPSPKSSNEIMGKYFTSLYSGSSNSSERLQLILFTASLKMVW